MTEHDTTELYRMLENADEPHIEIEGDGPDDDPSYLFDLREIGLAGDEDLMESAEFVRTVREKMPPDQVENIENRIGWDKITRIEDLNYAIEHALDEDQQQFEEGPFDL